MANLENTFTYSVPSKKKLVLERLIHQEIVDIIKCSFESYDEYIAYLDEVKIVGYRNKESFFKYSYGVFLIIFNNKEEYSFAVADDINSIILRCQKDRFEKKYEKYILEDVDMKEKISVMDLDDKNDLNKLINTKIEIINILTSNKLNPKQQALDSEQGIEFILQNDKKLILGYNLLLNSFMFALLDQDDQILTSIKIKYSLT